MSTSKIRAVIRNFTTRPGIRGTSGTFGAGASTHRIASTVGPGILERGGNVFGTTDPDPRPGEPAHGGEPRRAVPLRPSR